MLSSGKRLVSWFINWGDDNSYCEFDCFGSFEYLLWIMVFEVIKIIKFMVIVVVFLIYELINWFFFIIWCYVFCEDDCFYEGLVMRYEENFCIGVVGVFVWV